MTTSVCRASGRSDEVKAPAEIVDGPGVTTWLRRSVISAASSTPVRLVLLTAWVGAWFAERFGRVEHAFYRGRAMNDWQFFEFGARVLVHYDRHYPGGMHLYADYPWLQIGPPPLLLVGLAQPLPPRTVTLLCGVVMALAGVVAFGGVERAAARLTGARPAPAAVLVAGAVFLAAWGNGVGRFRHLDDVVALTATGLAVAVCASGRRWAVAGLLLGLAAASKPWAIVFAPVLFGLPRRDRARATLVLLGSCALWWLPFVVADPRTVGALGQFTPFVSPGSVLATLGVTGVTPLWVHPVQIAVALVVGLAVGARGSWAAVPLAALATRVLLDTQAWSYYGMSLLFATMLFDLATRGRRLPVLTVVTAAIWYVPPLLVPGATGWLRLGWAVAALAAACGLPARLRSPVVVAQPAAG
jgi:hypothetical protein